MEIEKYSKGKWYVKGDGVLLGGFSEEMHADLFIDALNDFDGIQALVYEIKMYRLAEKTLPEIPIREARYCGCIGPGPECACKIRSEKVIKMLKKFGGYSVEHYE